MSNLKDILAKLKDVQATSRINPEDASPKVRSGVEALVRNAKVDLENIEIEYKEAVMNTVVIIGVSGANAEAFAEIADSRFNVLTVDYKGIKNQIIAALKSRNSGELYTSAVHFMLLDELSKIRTKYNIVRLPTPQISGYNDGIYDGPLAKSVELLFEKNYESSLYSAVTRREIGALALNDRFEGKLLPVVIYNYTGQVDSNFLPNPVMTVDTTGEAISIKSVKSVLEKVKSIVTGKSNKQSPEDLGELQEDENEQ